MSYYITRKFLEAIFGSNPMMFNLPIVGTGKSKRGVSYSIKVKDLNPRQISQTFWRLRHTKLINFKEDNNGNIRVVLTDAGKKKILTYNMDALSIKTPKRWNGNWHIVVFDIPENKKTARNALVNKMKELGLLMFQKSVWIHPYDCKDEIDFVANFFNVGKYLHHIETKNMTNDDLLRERFNLPKN